MSYGNQADLALNVWVKLARCSAVLSRATQENISSFGLTLPQFGALEALYHKGPMTIGALCKKMLVTGGNMTVVIDNLEREGLVERKPKPGDRRAIELRLTTKGKTLIKKIFPIHAGHLTKSVDVLSEEEQKQLSDLLKKLGTGLALKDA